jgi:hypothetical protein
MIAELKRQGWLKSFVINNTPQAEQFTAFLATFWDWNVSPYVKEKLRKAHGNTGIILIYQIIGS